MGSHTHSDAKVVRLVSTKFSFSLLRFSLQWLVRVLLRFTGLARKLIILDVSVYKVTAVVENARPKESPSSLLT